MSPLLRLMHSLDRCGLGRLVGLAALALLVGGPAIAQANPVNAEKLLTDPEEGGWSGSLSTNFALSVGNVDRLSLGFSGGLQYWTLYPEGVGYRDRPAPSGARRFFRDRWVLITNAAFIRVGDNDVVNNGFAHTRYTRMWRPRVGSDFFAQSQYNEFKLLQQRSLGGLGIRVDPINQRAAQVWAGTGYMAEYERNNIDPAIDPHPARVVNHRWTSYAVLQLRLWDSAFVARNTTYFQPRFDDFADFRLLEALQMETRAGVVALGVEVELQYDNDPPVVSGVVPLDVFVINYLRIGGG
ncbi:MAG: DUF481 domain-containing protein [Myxococcota bacterium]